METRLPAPHTTNPKTVVIANDSIPYIPSHHAVIYSICPMGFGYVGQFSQKSG